MTIAVRGLLCFSLLMTFPVQYYPVIEILEDQLFPKNEHITWRETKRNVLRISLVTFGVAVAIAIPKFGLFMGFDINNHPLTEQVDRINWEYRVGIYPPNYFPFEDLWR